MTKAEFLKSLKVLPGDGGDSLIPKFNALVAFVAESATFDPEPKPEEKPAEKPPEK